MKLYYSAGSCSTSCHISLEESGLKYEAIGVDWDNENDPNIAIVNKLNPLGTLPIFITDEGVQLDQNVSIHIYISEKSANKKLLPPIGTKEHSESLNWLSFVAADLHKGIGALFSVGAISQDKATQETVKKFLVARSNDLLKYLDTKLANKDYLMGKDFSVADSYAFVVLGWCQWLEIALAPYKNVEGYLKRVGSRPAVMKVLKEEGLI